MIDLIEVLGHKYLMVILEFMNINENCKKWEEIHGKIWSVYTKSFVSGLLISLGRRKWHQINAKVSYIPLCVI